MVEMLQVIEKVSQNLHAELMLREVARVTRGAGTRESGLQELGCVARQYRNQGRRMARGGRLGIVAE